MKRIFEKAKAALARFALNEQGSLDNLVLIIGLAVVAVLIVGILMVAAPNTVGSIFQSFIGYMRSTFGF